MKKTLLANAILASALFFSSASFAQSSCTTSIQKKEPRVQDCAAITDVIKKSLCTEKNSYKVAIANLSYAKKMLSCTYKEKVKSIKTGSAAGAS